MLNTRKTHLPTFLPTFSLEIYPKRNDLIYRYLRE